MKEIVAIIRPEKWQATIEALEAIGVEDVLQRRVLGRGRQLGLRYFRPQSGSGDGATVFLPKRMLVCMVPDAGVEGAVEAILRVNKTGNFGDGKMFICSVSLPLEAEAQAGSKMQAVAGI